MTHTEFILKEIFSYELGIPIQEISSELQIKEQLSFTNVPDQTLINILVEINSVLGLCINMNDKKFREVETLKDLVDFIERSLGCEDPKDEKNEVKYEMQKYLN